MPGSSSSQLVAQSNAVSNATAFGNVLSPVVDNVVMPLVMLAFAVAVVVFVYGVMQMIIHATDSEAHTKGRWSMLSGIIGMFIMISAWGIIYLISNTVGQFR